MHALVRPVITFLAKGLLPQLPDAFCFLDPKCTSKLASEYEVVTSQLKMLFICQTQQYLSKKYDYPSITKDLACMPEGPASRIS